MLRGRTSNSAQDAIAAIAAHYKGTLQGKALYCQIAYIQQSVIIWKFYYEKKSFQCHGS